SMVVIESLHKGNLPVDDFLKVAQETASYLQDLRQRYSFERYHFFFSCPVPVAFMIGLAFGHYVDGSIYNYQRDGSSYEEVLDLRYLRKLREGCQIYYTNLVT
ncbi:MAG: SAVED domain-containing protein, partial [Candidatus Kryptonium sp.]